MSILINTSVTSIIFFINKFNDDRLSWNLNGNWFYSCQKYSAVRKHISMRQLTKVLKVHVGSLPKPICRNEVKVLFAARNYDDE